MQQRIINHFELLDHYAQFPHLYKKRNRADKLRMVKTKQGKWRFIENEIAPDGS